MSCLFCQIVAGDIPAGAVYRADGIMAFRDIAPQAPTHILIVPERHISGVADLGETDDLVAGRLLRVAALLARQEGIEASGYRLIVNQGVNAGQTVPHLHLHLLGGRELAAPLA